MRTLEEWFVEYAKCHQNETNTKIHLICVPAIYFSLVGILMSFDTVILTNLISFNHPIVINWAVLISIPVLLFYLSLSLKVFLEMLMFSALCIIVNYYLGHILPLFYTSLSIFIVAWIGQFYGHKIEGKKPSFFKDLQFLLIGPIWVFEKILGHRL